MKLPRAWALVALAATAVFWTALVAVPLVSVLMRAGGGHTLLDEGVLQAARMTLWQAGWSTLLSAGGGLALGLWLGSVREGRATKAAELFLAIPFGTPTLVVALSWVGILGRSNLNYSLHAVILAHVFLNIPLVALAVGFARREVPLPALEAVKTLGAGALTRFRFVIWPVIRGAFASSAAQVAALCSMSFALVLILGGGPPVETLETALYSRVRYGTLDLEAAAACAVWQIAITLLPWTLVLLLPAPIAGERASGRRGSSAGGGGLALFCAVFTLPYLILLRSRPWHLLSQPEVLAQIAKPLGLSAQIAGGTALLAVGFAVISILSLSGLRGRPIARKILAFALALPSGISVLVLGLGAWFAYGRWLDPFAGSLTAILLLQATIFFPVALRLLWPLAEGVAQRELEAAATLGATPLQAFLAVEWPRWRSPLVSAFALIAGAALGEVAAVSLFYSENLVPLSLLISRWSAQYRFEDAQAAATLLFIASAITMMFSFRLRGSGERLHA